MQEAEKAYQRSASLINQVTLLEPHEQSWQQNISALLDRIGDVLNARGRLEEALKNSQQSLAIRQKLVAHDPSNVGWQNDLAATYMGIAWYALFNQQAEQAIEASKQGLTIKTDEKIEAMLYTNLAHGFLFTGQFDTARAIYLNYQDQVVSDGRSFKQAVLDDFKELRQRGINHADMRRIEALWQ